MAATDPAIGLGVGQQREPLQLSLASPRNAGAIGRAITSNWPLTREAWFVEQARRGFR